MNLDAPNRIHVVNVGGAGMSGVATVLAQMGHAVTGVDSRETPFVAGLRSVGVHVAIGPVALDPAAAADTTAVVVSTATPPDHPDVVLARDAGVPVLHRRDALAEICRHRRVTAVAGTHGKSTTAAMLATILDAAGRGDGFLVGTTIPGLGSNADWRSGPGFVIEADESDGTFLELGASDAIVTNVEADHLAYWGDEAALVSAFERFVGELTGTAVVCADDAGSARLAAVASSAVTYGTDPRADVVIGDVRATGLTGSFTITAGGEIIDVQVPAAPGVHNARNAAAAITAAGLVGVDLARAAHGLAGFRGVARRFEPRGVIDGITFVDSYDHLPTEVEAALAAAASAGFDRVVCVFQPHRFTRTRDLASSFADSFGDADVLAVTELYPAGETPIPGVSGRAVLDAVTARHPDQVSIFLPTLDDVVEWLVSTLRPGDLCLTLNAGDLTTIPDRVQDRLRGTP